MSQRNYALYTAGASDIWTNKQHLANGRDYTVLTLQWLTEEVLK